MNKRSNPSYLRLFFLLFILTSLICVPPAAALKVSGSKYMDTLAPGAVAMHTMTIEIDGNAEPTDVAVDVMGFANAPDGSYTPLGAEEDTGPNSARAFISLDRNVVHLTPGTPEKVRATISVPREAVAGGKYAIIYIHSLPQGRGPVAFLTAIAVPVMITVDGVAATESGVITGVSAGKLSTGQPFIVSTGFRNTGSNHYYHVTDTVVISDQNGVIATGSYGPVPYAVIPGSTVQFDIPIDSPIPSGSFTAVSTVTKEDGTVLDQKSGSFEVGTSFTPPPKSVKIVLTPSVEGTLRSPDGRYEITFPAGSVLSDVEVSLSPVLHDQIPGSTNDLQLGTSCFVVDGLSGLLAKPATVRVKYSDDDLHLSGGDVSALGLASFNGAGNVWDVHPTSVDGTTLVAQSDRMGTWAVVASAGGHATPDGQLAPNEVAGSGGKTDALIVYGIVAVVIAILFAAVTIRKRKKKIPR